MTQDPIRHYVVLKADAKGVIPNYFNPDSAAADQWARLYIAEHVYEGAMIRPSLPSHGLPTMSTRASRG